MTETPEGILLLVGNSAIGHSRDPALDFHYESFRKSRVYLWNHTNGAIELRGELPQPGKAEALMMSPRVDATNEILILFDKRRGGAPSFFTLP